MTLLSQHTLDSPINAPKSCSLDFLLTPKSFNSADPASQHLSSITFVENQLRGSNIFNSSTKAAPTRERRKLPTSLAFRSIGYKSEALSGIEDLGLQFNAERGVISCDDEGRAIALVVSGLDKSSAIPGMYCSGWVKRGPTGVIANTMEDAFATATAITNDWYSRAPFLDGGEGWDHLKQNASGRGLRSVSWNDWLKIDGAEKARGKTKGKRREKFTSTQQMLQVLD